MRGLIVGLVLVALAGCGPSTEKVAQKDRAIAACLARFPLKAGTFASHYRCRNAVFQWFGPIDPVTAYAFNLRVALGERVDAGQMSTAEASARYNSSYQAAKAQQAQIDAQKNAERAETIMMLLGAGLSGYAAGRAHEAPTPVILNCQRIGNSASCIGM